MVKVKSPSRLQQKMNGNVVPGVEIEVTDISNGSAGDLPDISVGQTKTTDDNGKVSWEEVTSTVAAEYVVTFQENQNDNEDTATVTFIAGEVVNISASVSPTSAKADGNDSVEFTVLLEDEYYNPVEGVTVKVTEISNGASGDLNGIVLGEEKITDENGKVNWNGVTTDEAAEYTVTFEEQQNNNSATATVTFYEIVPGPQVYEVDTLLAGDSTAGVITDPNTRTYLEIKSEDPDEDIIVIFRWLDHTKHDHIGSHSIVVEDKPAESTVLVEFSNNTINYNDVRDALNEYSELVYAKDPVGTNVGGSRLYRLTTRFDGAEYIAGVSRAIVLEIEWDQIVSAEDASKFTLTQNGSSYEATEVIEVKDDGELTEFINVKWHIYTMDVLTSGDILEIAAEAVQSEGTGLYNDQETWDYDGEEWSKN